MSLPVKVKVAEEPFDGFVGLDVMVVSGGAVSTVHVKLAGVGSTFVAASTARTWNVCDPSARPVYVCGLVQGAKPAPSRAQSNVAPTSLEVNVNVAEVEFVGFVGVDGVLLSLPPPQAAAAMVIERASSVIR